MKKLLLIAALATMAPLMAQAESKFVTGSGALSASAKLDFSITIPQVLFLQVGTGSYADNTAVNNITFDVPAGSVGNGTQVAGTGGDLPGGSGVTVRVLSNSGNVTLDNTTNGPLSSGASAVQWSDILVTADALPATTADFSNGAIAHPPFNAGTGGGTSTAPTTLTATGGLVRQEGSWTFAYANTAALPAGTYGSTEANNGRVTYTATTP
ncbi:MULTISPECIES: hypothetical protein [unclassified Variovorax]|uniref:hypothetical protein n=1 Tax=unclassified Variovorax TaxID=663243 RepID=UPI00076D6984|nr:MULTISPECIES: hypothetical protein [unclassified Variovorax]KWT98652.1 hypothetical protein APY03_0235 [Variovorax sp. WDL1]PNG59379.1 hypothetical protein CHC07_01106 [Variovorax sp. B4]PNG60830.1 hypothetical protein CHC06_00729 [Variovorax sp. B2]VTV13250.1 hypothetical protein WDL1CHR_03935 [Variovorax sp. WDL1]